VIKAKLFTERNVKTERKESKELGRDLGKYTGTRDFGGLPKSSGIAEYDSLLDHPHDACSLMTALMLILKVI
jgi:hypothetical protein